jgi:hypothetical protein
MTSKTSLIGKCAAGLAIGLSCLFASPPTAAHFAGGEANRAQAARTGARPLELQDYYRIEAADSPAISPDGR